MKTTLIVEVEIKPDGSEQFAISGEQDLDPEIFAHAASHMMCLTAITCDLGFEETLTRLAQGARELKIIYLAKMIGHKA